MRIKDALLRRLAVRKNVTYGRSLHVGPRTVVWAPRRLTIGNDVYIGKNCTIEVDGTIGDGVLIANAVGIVGRRDHDMRQLGQTVRRSTWVGDDPGRLSAPITIGSDVWIGYGAIVLSGIHIGNSAIIAAGSIVLDDVAENAIVAGQPARVVGARFSESGFTTHWHLLSQAGVRSIRDGGA